jgi:hypothetical protein
MVIQSNRRDIAAALAAGDKSLMLNKYDMLALGEYGGRLVLAGDVDKGMKMLRDAGAHGAVRPAWHHIYMFIGSYVGGDMVEAVRQANDITVDDVALGQVARALAARAAGNHDGVRKAVERLIALGRAGAATPCRTRPADPGRGHRRPAEPGSRRRRVPAGLRLPTAFFVRLTRWFHVVISSG